jgi:hypothetical protein
MRRLLIILILLFALPAHAQGPIVFGKTAPPQNLLTNSSFGVWSNSGLAQGTTGRQTDYEYGIAIRNDDCEDDETASYYKWHCTLAFTADIGNGAGGSNGYYTATQTDSDTSIVFYGTYIPGHDYKFTIHLKNGTYTISTTDQIRIYTSGIVSINPTYLASCATWEDFSVIWRAVGTDDSVNLILALGAGQTIKIDNWHVTEVTPGCVAADFIGCDGWIKDSTLKILREPNGTNVAPGAYYALKGIPSAVNDYLYTPKYPDYTYSNSYERYSGRQVVFGAWVLTSTASHIRLRLYNGATLISGNFHTGGGTYEWLEVTYFISPTATSVYFYIDCVQSSGIFYVSQPIVTYGDRIGPGRYSRPADEIVYLEQDIPSHYFDGKVSNSTVARTGYIGGDSSAKIPYGAKALGIRIFGNDSGSAAGAANMIFGSDISDTIAECIVSLHGLANDTIGRNTCFAPCNENGDLEYSITATGAGTFDIQDFEYTAVQY